MPRDDPIFRQERIELDFKDVGLHGSVPSLGRLHTGRVHLPHDFVPPKPERMHEGIIEVHYLARGSQTWQVAGKEYRTRGGDLFVVLPGEEHGIGGHTQERQFTYWIRLRVNPKASGGKFLNFPKKIVKPMLDKLSGLRPDSRVFKASSQLQRLFDEVILAEAHTEAAMKPFAVSMGLLELVAEIVRCIEGVQTKRRTGDVAAILKYIDEHIEETDLLTNEELASQANLSRSRFQVKFRQQIGMSPAEYVLHRKIKQAEKLLATGRHTVTDVAMRLGFSSSQYFSTVFKKYTNKHPRDYLP